MNTHLHIVIHLHIEDGIQISDMSEPKNNCSVLTVVLTTFNFIEDGQNNEDNADDDGITQKGKFLMLQIVWFSIF